ncbi:DOMON-like domain-containing protein [Ottowia testudinis]|uniref:DOMON-like domain-containing protein n=1 Tax=Ottowia testudinis TaxID=2816950 RepID=A0A975CEU8_9BURK|nr:DOMON-like domain-containing protein [Ottowia testudinis]QTD44481.1 DOMON-like domain-containing protein [Ottowia testudinis]
MPCAAPISLPLVCHPATPCAAVRALSVEVMTGLRLTYTLHADLAQLRIPAPAPPGRADGLWQHTCFEAFISAGAEASYREFNFSPSGQWAVYAFSAERVRDLSAEHALAPPRAPRLHWAATAGGLTLHADIPATLLPARTGAALHIGLSAVIEARDGSLSYWALRHPAARPDFHQKSAWIGHLST